MAFLAWMRNRGMLAPARLLAAIAATAVVAPVPASAQYFGRNKVQYEDFDFQVLKTPHFQIYYYPEASDAVEDAARMSERWYERFARTFQHEFEQPKPIVLYADHPDFQQTNTLSGFISEGTGGVTESLKNRVILPLTGSYWDSDHVLGHELVHAFQYNIAQSRSGGGLQGLSRLPLWTIEGFAEYFSVGREDPLTAMWLRDAIRRDDFPTIEQMTRESRFFPYRFGQALWAYIGGTYGDDAVISIFRRALRIGWEASLNGVLGIESDSLSAHWKRSIEADYLPLMEGRTPPEDMGRALLTPELGAGRQNVSPSISPDGRYVAFMSEKDLFSIDLFLADATTGKIIRKLSSASSDPHFEALRFIDSAGSWAPDGSQFVFSVFADGDNQMVIVDTDDGDVARRIEVEDEIGAINHPAWSPDGRSIAFSGSRGGISDLYIYDVETEAVRQLTDDRNGDFQPAWSPDGRTIAFVSDRGPETDFRNLRYSKFQIALMDLSTGRIETLPLFGNVKHLNPQWSADGRSLYFISDQDGFSDIYRVTLENREIQRVTTAATAVSGITAMSPAMSVAAGTGEIVFSVFDAFEFHVYALDAQPGSLGPAVAASEQPAPGRILPPVETLGIARVSRYLDDPTTGLPGPGTYLSSDADKYSPSLALDYVGQPTLGVGVNQWGNYLGGAVSAFFSDMLGNRVLGVALQASGTVKDIGGQAFYTNLSNRWNWAVGGGRIPYRYEQWGLAPGPQGTSELLVRRTRIFLDTFTGTVAYPFSSTRRFETSAGFTRYSYDVEEESLILDGFNNVVGQNIEQRDDLELDALNLFRASAALVGDNTVFAFTSPVQGGRFRLEFEQTFGTRNFGTVIADYRRYFHPTTNLTLAVRGLHYGRYAEEDLFSRDPNIFDPIQPLFLGYETLIRGYAWESFEVGECTETIDGSCPEFDRLWGHRVGVVNAEARIPLLGIDQFGLISFPYLPTELVFFADAGIAWDSENGIDSFSFRTDREDQWQRIPLVSAGVSARVNLLGFLILESYYAFPFQRPEKGWHWGFNLAPGW
jgi:Tol biopolymer transport system component